MKKIETVLRLEEVDPHGVKFHAIAYRLTPFKYPCDVFEAFLGKLDQYDIHFDHPLRVIAEVKDINAAQPEIISMHIAPELSTEMKLLVGLE